MTYKLKRFQNLKKPWLNFFLTLKFTKKALLLATLIFLVSLGVVLIQSKDRSLNKGNSAQSYPETADLAQKNYSFQELSNYFTQLATKKGAEYALAVLKVAPVPPGTDMHLLGHVVGDILYKQTGADGIRVCTEDFRNACSHAIVVGLFADKKEAALQEINEACRQAPGGSGAYSMCFHGLGHGVLSSHGYDMEKATAICKKTSLPTSQLGIETIQCISGTVMEIISGGGHDRAVWEIQNKKYLRTNEPLSLCQSDFMPDEAQFLCFDYLTPFLFVAAGGTLASPTPADFKKAFTYCEGIPVSQTANRDSCFGGFGKEFVVLAQQRDIRKIDQMDNEQLGRVYEWCQLAQAKEGTAACIVHAVNSIYWGGENDPKTAVNFCNIISDGYQKNSCFVNLMGAVFYFKKDASARQAFCSLIPPPYRSDCQNRLEQESR